uniref:Uncharacterized protein n=1 Tax=Plectus sambesii TaxID=2011161 RepID=A0A914XDN9_9BILA
MIWFRQSKKAKLRKALKRTEEMEKKLVTQRDFFKLRIAALKFRDCTISTERKKVEREIAGAEYRLSLIDKQMKYILIVRETLHNALASQSKEVNKELVKVVSFDIDRDPLKSERKATLHRPVSSPA